MQRETPEGILNRPLVMLAIMFSVPALLVLLGFLYVVQAGAPPGGTNSACERFITDEIGFRIDRYQFSAGLTRYEDQTFSVSRNGGETWERVVTGRVQNPQGVTCEENIRRLDDANYLLFHRKNVALSQNGGADWMIHNICDDPRPPGRCDDDAIDFRQIDVSSPQQITITVQETVVDEYGIPQTEGGAPLILDTYMLQTDDGGRTWQLMDDNSS